MKLSEKQKQVIVAEYKKFEAQQYAGKTKEERQKFGQFYTPPELSIKMLEKFDTVKDKDILDPTVGVAGLLVAAIICGADPTRCYGIELDPEMVVLARKRVTNIVDRLYKGKVKFPEKHIKLGNALNSDVYEDFDNYEDNVEEAAKEAAAKRQNASESNTKVEKVKKLNKVKTAVKKTVVVKHDQDALYMQLEKMYSNIKLIVTELKFPDVESKRSEFEVATNGKSKKAVMNKVAKLIEDKLSNGYWILNSCLEDVKMLFALNDVNFSINDDRLLDVKLEDMQQIANEQMFDSYDDLKS